MAIVCGVAGNKFLFSNENKLVPINLPGTPFRRAINASELIRKELMAIIKQRKIDLAENKAAPSQDILSHVACN